MTNEMANSETPNQYLETHYLTRELARLRVTDAQLQGMRFTGTNKDWPFDQWSFTGLGTIPRQAIPLVKAYCALKWLILENPSNSRDKDDAWRLVSETMAAPTFAIGERTRYAQSTRAKKPRGRINDDGRTIDQVIRELALKPQYRRNPAIELWPHLRGLLGEDLDPQEITDQRNPEDPKKWAYTYDFKGGRKQITFLRFKDIVSQARRKKKSR